MIQDDFRAVIDVGTTKVTAMLVKQRPDREVELVGVGVQPCSAMRRGTISDPREVTESVRAAVKEVSVQTGKPIARAYLCLTASNLEASNQSHNVPRGGAVRAITEEDLRFALRTASNIGLPPGMRLVHVIPRGYSLDGLHGVRNPLGMHAAELNIQSHCLIGDVRHVEMLSNAVRAAGITPSEFIVAPVAIGDAVLTAEEREEGVVLVDVGGGTSDIAVYADGCIVHTTTLPVGGYQITNDLSIAFDIDYEAAEQLKLDKGSATPELVGMAEEITIQPRNVGEPINVTQREVGQIIKERVAEIFSLVQIKLEQEDLGEVSPASFVFTGGGSNVDGFAQLAKVELQRPSRIAMPRGVAGLTEQFTDPAYASAAGAVLWGIQNLPRESHVGRPPKPVESPVTDEGAPSNIFSKLATAVRSWFGKA